MFESNMFNKNLEGKKSFVNAIKQNIH